MAAKVITQFSEYKLEDGEDWVEYAERFEMFLMANEIGEEGIMRATFLASIGGSAYRLLRSLVGEAIKTMKFEDLVKALKDHLRPAPNVIAERFHFFKRDRKSGETVNDYVSELRRLSEHCGFGGKLSTYLRDHFVCGLNSEGIQQKLLTAKDLTLDKAIEAASRDAKLIRCVNSGVSVHHVPGVEGPAPESGGPGCIHRVNQPGPGNSATGNSARQQDQRACFWCGNRGHLAAGCAYKGFLCHKCGKVGHLEKRCEVEGKRTGSFQAKSASVRQVCACPGHDGSGVSASGAQSCICLS
jgi:hypothetical protein